MNIIVFGPPGAGKGTQAELIASSQKLHHLSSGALLRTMFPDKALGEKIKSYVSQGALLPNKLMVQIIEAYIVKNKKVAGFVFDGYPRTLTQAKKLDCLAKKHQTKIDLVINLKLNQKESLSRILKRGKISGRVDDNLKTIKNRLIIYDKITKPVLKYYQERGILKEINGQQTILKISKDIKKVIEKEKTLE